MTTLTTKQKLLIVLCTLVAIVAIVATTVMATIAYLTSSAAVSNVFTIGDISITLTESKVNNDGTLFDGGATQVDTNTYHLIPAKSYIKDPHIDVLPGSENSYLFVLVRNDIEAIESQLDSKPSIAKQMAANGWQKYTLASTGWVYVYVGFDEVDDGEGGTKLVSRVPENNWASDAVGMSADSANNFRDTITLAQADNTYPLFTEFTIGSVAEDTLRKYGAAKITLTAVAIQDTEKFVNGVHDAWVAVTETYPYIHTGSN